MFGQILLSLTFFFVKKALFIRTEEVVTSERFYIKSSWKKLIMSF
jgi:hypothetical protein